MSAPKRKQEVVIPEWKDDCITCGVCDAEEKCSQCNRPVCTECISNRGRCSLCESYNLPRNFTLIPETAHGFRSTVEIMLNSHEFADVPGPYTFWYDDKSLCRVATVSSLVFPGVGIHYHTIVEDDDNPLWYELGKAWVTLRDHYTMRPQWMEMRGLNTAKAAAEWACQQLMEHYGDLPTYVVIRSNKVRRWFYREGD